MAVRGYDAGSVGDWTGSELKRRPPFRRLPFGGRLPPTPIEEPGRAERIRRFEELVLPHAGALYRTAYHLTGAASDAEDLTQETYLHAYRAFAGFRGGDARPWLFSILRHAFFDDYRRRRRGPEAVEDVAVLEAMGDARDDASGPWARSAEAEALRDLPGEFVERALAELPPEWRLVVLLADVEELSYREIAVATGTPLGTVMSRLHRGRKRLYERLRDHVRAPANGQEGLR